MSIGRGLAEAGQERLGEAGEAERQQQRAVQEAAVVRAQQRAEVELADRRRELAVEHPHHLLGGDPVRGDAGDEGAGARADVDVELVDGAVDREQVEGAQGADLVDAAGEAAAAEDEGRLRALPAPPASSRALAGLLALGPLDGDYLAHQALQGTRRGGGCRSSTLPPVPSGRPRDRRLAAPFAVAGLIAAIAAPAGPGLAAEGGGPEAVAPLPGPDIAARTQAARRGQRGREHAAGRRTGLSRKLGNLIDQAGSGSGVWVADTKQRRGLRAPRATTRGSSPRTRSSSRPRPRSTGSAPRSACGPASSTDGEVDRRGVLRGNLFLVGDGDPALSRPLLRAPQGHRRAPRSAGSPRR